MAKPTKQEVIEWLKDSYYGPLTEAAIEMLRAAPEPEPEWGPWIGWNGGECPITERVMVQALLSDGGMPIVDSVILDWDFDGAYRVKRTPPEPEIWYRLKGGQLLHPDEVEGDAMEKVEVRVLR